jgi:formylglycine-generating enzyme required for sulfatase activity
MVKLNSFAMSRHEVTQRQYKDVMGINPSYFKDCMDCPVDQVSWEDAQEFIRRLNSMQGNPYNYRMPTEAEWEYAASSNKKTLYAGSDDIQEVANYSSNSNQGTRRVGSRKANAFGLYDMSGNVQEWCQDVYLEDAYAHRNQNPATGQKRVVRGGSWYHQANYCRVKNRGAEYPDERKPYIGFRLVRDN